MDSTSPAPAPATWWEIILTAVIAAIVVGLYLLSIYAAIGEQVRAEKVPGDAWQLVHSADQ